MNLKENRQAAFCGNRIHMLVASLFLLSIVLVNQVENSFVTLFYYVTAMAACIVGIAPDGKRVSISRDVVVFAVIIAACGIVNVLFTGNSTINKQFFTLCSIGIALLFMQKDLNPNLFVVVMLLNAAVVVVRFIMLGVEEPVYIRSSNNFVSVHLLLPTVIYYSSNEQHGKLLRLWPAVVVWLICLVAQGRGGILSSTVFLAALCVLRAKEWVKRLPKKAKVIAVCSVVVAAVILIICIFAFDFIHKIEILQKFAEHGLGDNGRFPIWTDYLKSACSSAKNAIFAPDMTEIIRVVNHDGNLHNSLLNIHAYNGAVAAVVVILLMIYAAFCAVIGKKWIFLICFATLCLRGATDYVFWGTTGTPFFLYFILLPLVENGGRRKKFEIDTKALVYRIKEERFSKQEVGSDEE